MPTERFPKSKSRRRAEPRPRWGWRNSAEDAGLPFRFDPDQREALMRVFAHAECADRVAWFAFECREQNFFSAS